MITPPCYEFVEHKDWENKHPLGPVTWDGWCSKCGFRIEDAPFDDGMGIGLTSKGKRLARCATRKAIDGEVFISAVEKVYCSDCVPGIK